VHQHIRHFWKFIHQLRLEGMRDIMAVSHSDITIDFDMQVNEEPHAYFAHNTFFSTGHTVNMHGDGLGVWDAEKISLIANSQGAEVLLMDVPMSM